MTDTGMVILLAIGSAATAIFIFVRSMRPARARGGEGAPDRSGGSYADAGGGSSSAGWWGAFSSGDNCSGTSFSDSGGGSCDAGGGGGGGGGGD